MRMYGCILIYIYAYASACVREFEFFRCTLHVHKRTCARMHTFIQTHIHNNIINIIFTHVCTCVCVHTHACGSTYACDSQKCTCKAPLNFPNPIDGDLAILLKSQWRCIRDIPKQKCISPWDGIKPLRWFAFHTTVRQRYRRSKQSHTPEICN